MKNEIEKLYELAGILKECLSPCYINKTWRKTHDCPNCDNRENYPPFTAEKQIELIKWLGEWDYTVRIDFHENECGIAIEYHSGNFQDNLSEALASIINDLWQDLTETEKEEIRKILRG